MGRLIISSTNRQRKRGGRFFIQTAEGNSSSSSQPGDSNRRQGTVSIQMHPEETDDSLRGCGRRGEYGYEDHNSKRREQNILPSGANPPHAHQEKHAIIIITQSSHKQLSLKHLLDKDFKSYLPLIMQQLTFSPAYDSLWIQ